MVLANNKTIGGFHLNKKGGKAEDQAEIFTVEDF
jgi:hypothetical protein